MDAFISPERLAHLEKKTPSRYVPLDQEIRTTVDTAAAAYHLNRATQTLRTWATCTYQRPPITPVRINGRLAWPVARIKQLVGLSTSVAA